MLGLPARVPWGAGSVAGLAINPVPRYGLICDHRREVIEVACCGRLTGALQSYLELVAVQFERNLSFANLLRVAGAFGMRPSELLCATSAAYRKQSFEY
jgi:hypothetical protein